MDLNYDIDLAGTRYVYNPNGSYVADWVTSPFHYGYFDIVPQGASFTATGYYYLDGTLAWVQTTDGVYISVELYNDIWKRVWDTNPGYVSVRKYTDSQAQYVINKMIDNNKIILQNNLLCARYANRFTAKQQAQIRELQERLQARNGALQAEGLVRVDETGSVPGFAEFSPYLTKLMNGEAVGIASWVAIVLVAVVVAGLGTAAYYAYKSLYDESERDVKFSQDLTRSLVSKLTEEEYQQLLDETKGIVTKAKIKQALGSYWNMVKIAAFAVAGYFGYKFIKERLS